MNNQETYINLIRKRTSIRKYSDKSIDTEVLDAISTLCKKYDTGPFGSKIRYQLIPNLTEDDDTRFGTYGFISGAPYFIAGAVNKNHKAFLDFGFTTENLILELTKLNLGTCWLGGTFSRGKFAEEMNLGDDELLPCITPVGYATKNRGFREKLIRYGAKADTRLPFDDLFFNTQKENSLPDDYTNMLECVRMAPSASNKQPWRVFVDGNKFGFYLKRTPGYGKLMPGNDLQQVDLGIALAHFTGVAQAFGYNFEWNNATEMKNKPEMEAIAEIIVNTA